MANFCLPQDKAVPPSQIRNFCIIAHIDHGKSTLADRFLEITHTVSPQKMRPQYLDFNPISRERGITIKLAPVRMRYQLPPDLKKFFILNLIDTPGHVDFSYEVSRSLAACEGAILLVDATQGIQAQTISHFQQAKKQNLALIPVINKIDLQNAHSQKTAAQLINLGFQKQDLIFISAKTGQNVQNVLRAVAQKIPPPSGQPQQPLRALVFDSFYDPHQGVVVFLKLVDGKITLGQKCQFLASQSPFTPLKIGYLIPELYPSSQISSGEIGFISTGLKNISLTKIGDTIISAKCKTKALPGYQEPKPMVFIGLYPGESNDFLSLRQSLEKLKLNDASLQFVPEFSPALGKGFRCGFLGLLHAEITKERLRREFHLHLVSTLPHVEYQIKIKSAGQPISIKNISQLPENYDQILEPWMKIVILSPQKYLGPVFQICQNHRAILKNTAYLSNQVAVSAEIPLSELIINFYDQLKTVSSGYASLDYQFLDYRPVNAVKLDILLHHQKIAALSQVVLKEKAYQTAKKLVGEFKENLPRQLFSLSIQAAIGSKIIVGEILPAYRKDVTAKLYGGDRTRKDKLLKKQKKGKKRLQQFAKITLPPKILSSLLTNFS